MLTGYLDAVTSSGHIAGWAYDTDRPFPCLRVAILTDDGREIGRGLACGFRVDLMMAGMAGGWCAFKVKLGESPTGIRSFGLMALDREANASLIARQSVPYVVQEETPIRSIPDLIADDPTQMTSLDQLSGCDDIFKQYIKDYGIDTFVRTAYLYVLARPADPAGLATFRKLLKAGNVTPYGLLVAMSNSDEYRSKAPQHCAPTMPAFPFRIASC